MAALADRVAIVTGAGSGIGRAHALLFAAEGAKVVVNDVGVPGGADAVVEEITTAGGAAIANHDDPSEWDAAARLVASAVHEFGDLHVLVNNTTLLRDRMLVNMTPSDWDDVVRAHLRGHFCPTRHAAEYWRDRQRAGHAGRRAVINTSSASGLVGAVGQSSYGAAKMAVAALTIIAAQELARYGVRVNAIAPAVTSGPGATGDGDGDGPVDGQGAFDPADAAPFAAYLATADCPINGRVFFVVGGEVHLFQPWTIVDGIERDGRWTVEGLAVHAARFADVPFVVGAERVVFESEPSS